MHTVLKTHDCALCRECSVEFRISCILSPLYLLNVITPEVFDARNFTTEILLPFLCATKALMPKGNFTRKTAMIGYLAKLNPRSESALLMRNT